MRVFAAVMIAAIGVGPAFAANSGKCVRFRDLEAFSRVSDNVLRAQTTDRKAYEIKFAGRCNYHVPTGNFFVTDNNSGWECLEPGDHLPLTMGGTCVVSEMKPVEKPAAD